MSAWEHRLQPEVQMGNGTLLATFDPNGEIEQIFAPHIDAMGSRIGTFRNSLVVPATEPGAPPEIIRIEPGLFHVRLKLGHGCQVLEAEYHHKFRPLRIQRRLALHPTDPLILDTWKSSDARVGLLHESVPWMGHATSAHCSLYHPTFNGLVHHRGRRWFGIMARGKTQWVRVGHLSEHDRYRLWNGEKVAAPIGASDLSGFPSGPVRSTWDQVVQGSATWGAIALGPEGGPEGELELAVICADSERHLGKLLEMVNQVPVRRYYQMIEGMVERRHAPAQATLSRIHNPRVRAQCERSIDVLHALQDVRTGALMAAAEVDPHSRMSGGYGFSWPRDGAYLAWALELFGFRERVEHYFRFLAETQDASGAWWQRYLATGHAGPSWGRIQIDEPATVVTAAYFHYRQTQDLFWLEKFWPVIDQGLKFLERFHPPELPMGYPSHDLWEERMGVHAYSLSAVACAFLCGAILARELSNRPAQVHYHRKADAIRKILYEKFIGNDGPVRRSFVIGHWGEPGHWDEMMDTSLLGMIIPFGMLHKRDRAASRILEALKSKLWVKPTGGLMRYEWDNYRGGNPWVLTTLWLAMVDLELGNRAEARECFQWVMSKATPLGMLPEQVHRETGRPYWVIPLGWSHAMFLVFVRQVLDRGAEGDIWENL